MSRSAADRPAILRRAGLPVALLLIALTLALALAGVNFKQVGHALARARLGWMALAMALMMLAFLMRAISWQQVLRAALPELSIRWPWVVRAAMIGVMGSAVIPGRLGEPARAVVLTRRLSGHTSTLLPIVAGTMLSQTLMNLIALGVLAVATFSNVALFAKHEAGILIAAIGALLVLAVLLGGPWLLNRGNRALGERSARYAALVARLLRLARRGLLVFTRPRHAIPALFFQLAAWALQWLSCYAVLNALSLQHKAGLVAAAAILLAVNVSAILPPTPSNVGIFQAACLVVLAAFGVSAGIAIAYGFALQAVELSTAVLMGVPALLGEGTSWREVRAAAQQERRRETTEEPQQ